MKTRYTGIDIVKFLFACLIPFLHISFGDQVLTYFLGQYLARLGVPFFFAASGYFLSRSMEKRGSRDALLRYEKRIGKLLLIWVVIYLPFFIYFNKGSLTAFVQELLFVTPGYLWYLTALLVGAIPFCLIRKRHLLYYFAAVMYIFGTLISESYDWLTGGFPAYTDVFLTSRNGMFFALPMMCVGELHRFQKKCAGKTAIPFLFVAVITLFAEITFVGRQVSSGADRSMYFLLPVCVYFLLNVAKQINVETDFASGGESVAIYLMQYGFIKVMVKLREYIPIPMSVWAWVVYGTVILGGCFFYRIFRKNKLLKHLFS